MRVPKSLRFLPFSLLLAANMCQFAFAQDASTEEETTVMYPASYFEQYAPVSARDMLDRIPGVGSTTGGGPNGSFGGNSDRGGRGFGGGSGGSEILINGKRTAGKNNQTRNLLRRITTEQVDYIELIRGTSGELDVRGSAQVVNVVLFEELSNSSVSYEANMDRYRDGENQPGGSITYSNQIGGLDYVLSAVAEPRYNHSESDEFSILGDFSPNDTVREDRITDQLGEEVSANLEYEINGNSSARFNALYSQNDNPTDLFRRTTDLRVTPNSIENEREDIPGDRDNWEIGGDYEYLSDQGSRFKVLFISNQDNRSTTRERYQIASDGSETKNLFLDSGRTLEERIVRGSYTFDIFENQDIEFGAERAQTILDSNLALGVASSTGTPSPAFGGLVPVAVNNANSKVEEIRYEPFAIHNWIINPRMSLESTLLYETSEITQSGDVSKKRDFDFLKPKVDYRFDLTPAVQLRGSIQKVVSQLRFSDFVASTDEQDNDSNTLAGNANLTQMWFWKYDFNAEYRLPNDIGVIDANIYYHDHHDMIDRIDVSPSEDDLQSASGNIGDGKMYGLTINASVRMNMINMPNLLVSSRFNVADSEIKDPFLGIDRRFANFGRGRWSVSFRHDLPQWNMNYGASWNNRFDSNQKRYDIDDVVDSIGEPQVSLFLEFIAFGGTTFRFDARDTTNNLQCRERTRFLGHISAGIIEEIEDQCSSRGRVLSLKISGTY
ncbi:MAG: TonB-dependent receptor plug domain-containing protein [Gammaproteobacteria bacterium]|nr:TonB-dependent receptor plug domain-containing protein [Gammaproteobacteria bacterium]